MKYIFLILFLFPYRSLSQDLFGVFVPNYYFLLPYLLYFSWHVKIFSKLNFRVLFFPFLFFLLIFYRLFFLNRELTSSDINIVFLFFFVFFLTEWVILNRLKFIWIVKKLLFLNVLYAAIQNILILIGLDSLVMFHSNLKAQLNYIQPVAIYPIYRVNGFFNESSQLVIFLVLSTYFLMLYEERNKKIILYIYSLLSFSKTGYMYVVVMSIFSGFYRFLFISFFLLMGFFYLQYNYENLDPFLKFSIFALEERINGLELSLEKVSNVWFGENLSDVEGLDFISYYYTWFGLTGVLIVLFYLFYLYKLSKSFVLIMLVFVSLLANGVLPSMQYIFFYVFSVLIYLKLKRL